VTPKGQLRPRHRPPGWANSYAGRSTPPSPATASSCAYDPRTWTRIDVLLDGREAAGAGPVRHPPPVHRAGPPGRPAGPGPDRDRLASAGSPPPTDEDAGTEPAKIRFDRLAALTRHPEAGRGRGPPRGWRRALRLSGPVRKSIAATTTCSPAGWHRGRRTGSASASWKSALGVVTGDFFGVSRSGENGSRSADVAPGPDPPPGHLP